MFMGSKTLPTNRGRGKDEEKGLGPALVSHRRSASTGRLGKLFMHEEQSRLQLPEVEGSALLCDKTLTPGDLGSAWNLNPKSRAAAGRQGALEMQVFVNVLKALGMSRSENEWQICRERVSEWLSSLLLGHTREVRAHYSLSSV